MTLKERALAAAALKALGDLVKERDGDLRVGLKDDLLALYAESGSRTLDVRLPSGEKVAAVSLVIPSGGGPAVRDPQAFLAHVKASYPDAIFTPPPPAEQVRSDWQAEYLASLTASGPEAVDPTTGEVVPGVVVEECPPPKTFSVRFAADGKALVLDAWRTGALAALDEVPMLEGE